jgi:regulator of protease activity HflC (stomatin/prohibitin superfamily)
VPGLHQASAEGEAGEVDAAAVGRYRGTIRDPGLHWVNPLARRRKVSTRIRNQESAQAKVNDADGNPIEIAAVVVWLVRDTASALYSVDDFTQFVTIQTETAVRHIASSSATRTTTGAAALCRCVTTQRRSRSSCRRRSRTESGQPAWRL